MNPKLFLIRIISVLLLAAVLVSVFLPFYAELSDGLDREGISYIGLLKEKDDIYTIRNGLGSILVYLNVLLSIVSVRLIFQKKKPLKQWANYCIFFFVGCWLTVKIGQFAAGFLLSPPDKLLIGYNIMFLCQISLLGLLFRVSRRHEYFEKEKRDELIDADL